MGDHPVQLTHASPDRLRAFIRGEVSEDEAVALESHLRVCEACGSRFESLDMPRDRWADLLREAASSCDWADGDSPPGTPEGSIQAGYELIEPIGHGGMGVVYKARQLSLDRIVALKLIRSDWDASPTALARFRAEAIAVAQLDHPGIVRVLDVGQLDRTPFLSMEYIAGGSLADRLEAGPLSPRQAARMHATIAAAIHFAHQAHIVHRDLKPANILLTTDGEPRVSDFGLAKRLDAPVSQTQTGALLGTPCYMAPEQVDGRPSSPATDVYGLGAVLYHCLAGRPPYQAPTTIETLDLVRQGDPPSLHRLQPGLPRELEIICRACLQVDPSRRYPSAAALAEDLTKEQAWNNFPTSCGLWHGPVVPLRK